MHLERHTLGSGAYYITDYRFCQVPTIGLPAMLAQALQAGYLRLF